ncbi:MAG: aspartate aminotransferase family protein [Gammaproteobacteria bacterium]|nr:aspartate aminotransferase family protein [Gammaproteobacteria bacterium]MDE2261791.1 aspartate aminotransferase family protein [Gammaproteobacteria bacterium]
MSTQTDLSAFWMPFTANRHFKRHPTLVTGADGAYFSLADGRRLFDCLSGLWCTPLGHGRPEILAAVRAQAGELDFAPTFQVGHPKAFELAARIAQWAPEGLNRVFFTNSGSEAVDSGLKIALAYHHARGEASRVRVIGRERAYHGVGIGGISAGGIAANRRLFGALSAPFVDHLPHTHDPAQMGFSRGQPAWGAHLADALERLVALHDASTIAAVIVEPMQGSTGVIVPPLGYLERLREICTRHGILLIFDEVITGFGRLGANFAAQRLGVTPDIIVFAKAATNGVIPLGGAIVQQSIHDTMMRGPEQAIEFLHGYTYSGHPIACAAGLATLDVFANEGMVARAARLERVLEDAVHSLQGEPHVIDIRNFGLAAAVELRTREGQPGARGREAFERGVQSGLLLRFTADTIAMAPPFISTEEEIANMVELLRGVLRRIA